MLNKENINKVINALEAEDAFFDMGDFDASCVSRVHDCGTPACIGGWARYLEHQEKGHVQGVDYQYLCGWRSAAEYLGLSEDSADELFFPARMSEYDIPKEDAIEVLEHLLDTGEVNWYIVEPK